MNWDEIKKQYPEKLVLVEAIKAFSGDNKRHIEEMTVVASYDDIKKAWENYKKLRKDFSNREFYIFHTSKEKIEVLEQPFGGIRGAI